MHMKTLPKILIITDMLLPVPNIGGGATEYLCTALLKQNEKFGNAYFYFLSTSDKKLNKYSYNYSKIYYFKNLNYYHIKSVKMLCEYIIYRIKYLLNGNKHNKHFDIFTFQILKIIKKNNINIVVNEGFPVQDYWCEITNLINDNFYNHIHQYQSYNKKISDIIPNTISVSKYIRKVITANKINSKNDFVLYNCIDQNLFSKHIDNNKRHKLRLKMGFSERDILTLFVGRIIPEKGIEELLSAFDNISNKNIKLLVIGGCDYGVNYKTEFYKKIINKISLMSNVKYLGQLTAKDVALYYQLSDVLVIPSICEEGACLVGIEGMASGLPIICTKSGGMNEYISSDCSIKINNDYNLVKNLKNSIIKMANDEQLRKQLGNNGLSHSKKYSEENYYINFLNIVNNNK